MSDNDALLPLQTTDYAAVMAFTLSTVAPASAATYRRTYDRWLDFCASRRLRPLDLRPLQVREFLAGQAVTRRTRQRHLAALRKLARTLALDPRHPEYRSMYEALRLLRAPEDNLAGRERERRALNPGQVLRAFQVWEGSRLLELRNRALLGVLFYTGLRRAEAVALRWSDIDLQAGIIRVRHGKGDRTREAAIIDGGGDTALLALWAYSTALSDAAGKVREFVFCPISKGDKPGPDKPVSVRAVNQIIEKTVQLCGIEFTPHDARRTLGTDLLANSFPVSDVQAQLGHSHASTTIQSYALPADARKRRGRFKTSY